MRKIAIAIALTLMVSQAAYADEVNTVYLKDSTGWLVPVEAPTPSVVAPNENYTRTLTAESNKLVLATETVKKLTFKDKHPKLYKVGRKTRTVCIFCRPLVDVSVSVGQLIVLMAGLL